jgi:hypothetical protein
METEATGTVPALAVRVGALVHDAVTALREEEVAATGPTGSRCQQDQQGRQQKEQQDQQEMLQVERDIIKGELLVYKSSAGSQLNVDDFTSKERFLELERIRDAYARIFTKSWQATKKAIRKEILSQPYESPKKEKQHGKKED